MKISMHHLFFLIATVVLISCGGKEKKKEGFSVDRAKSSESVAKEAPVENAVPASERIALDNKGVGQIKDMELEADVNTELAATGAALYKTNCTACHKLDKRFIGPSPKGILERRSPEWIMNMILDPQSMVKNDPLAKDLLIEFNGAAMANQNLTVDESRAILEYFRTL